MSLHSCNKWFRWPTRVHIPNVLSISSAILAQLMVMSNRQTDRQTNGPRHISNNRPHFCTPCMRCGLKSAPHPNTLQQPLNNTLLSSIDTCFRPDFRQVLYNSCTPQTDTTYAAVSLEWPGGIMVRALDSQLKGCRFDSQLVCFQATTLGKLFAPMCLCYQAEKFATSQTRVIPCGWKSKQGISVALAICHRLKWFNHPRATGREMSTLPTLL